MTITHLQRTVIWIKGSLWWCSMLIFRGVAKIPWCISCGPSRISDPMMVLGNQHSLGHGCNTCGSCCFLRWTPNDAVGLSCMAGFGSSEIKYRVSTWEWDKNMSEQDLSSLWKQQFDFIWFFFHWPQFGLHQLFFIFGSCVTYFHSRYAYIMMILWFVEPFMPSEQ